MFDIGWGELFLIGVVALIVVGPKELPGLFRTVGQWTGKARGMAREFQRSLEQAANESGMDEVSRSLRSLDGVNLRSPGAAVRDYAAKTVAGGDDAPGQKPDTAPQRKPEAAAEAQPGGAVPAAAPEPAGSDKGSAP